MHYPSSVFRIFILFYYFFGSLDIRLVTPLNLDIGLLFCGFLKISFSLPKFSKEKKHFCPFRRPPLKKEKEKRTCQWSPLGPAGRPGRYREKRRWAGPTTIERV